LNTRERFNAVMAFEENSRNIKLEYGYWAGLIKKWNEGNNGVFEGVSTELADIDLIRTSIPLVEGTEEKSLDTKLMAYFGLEPYPVKFPCNFSPMADKKIIEKNNDFTVFIDEYCLTQKVLAGGTSVPMTLDYAVKNRNDFENYKSLYSNKFNNRLPDNFDMLANKLKNRDFAIRLGGHPFGFCGIARHIMGEFNYMLGLYDNPLLIKEINEFYLNFVCDYWAEILKKVEIDWIMIWEDMAFKTGPIISREAFREFMSPYYVRFIDFLKQYKVKNIIVDSDGLIEELIPLWVELGVTGIFPMEAVNDIIKIRNEFPGLQIIGGVDKRIALNDNTRDMDKEFEKIGILLKKGGYIPHIDHSIPMDTDFARFKQYRTRLNRHIDDFKD